MPIQEGKSREAIYRTIYELAKGRPDVEDRAGHLFLPKDKQGLHGWMLPPPGGEDAKVVELVDKEEWERWLAGVAVVLTELR